MTSYEVWLHHHTSQQPLTPPNQKLHVPSLIRHLLQGQVGIQCGTHGMDTCGLGRRIRRLGGEGKTSAGFFRDIETPPNSDP